MAKVELRANRYNAALRQGRGGRINPYPAACTMGDDVAMHARAATTLQELLREKDKGRVVNPHLVQLVVQPQPDFEAMQRAIEDSSLGQGKDQNDGQPGY